MTTQEKLEEESDCKHFHYCLIKKDGEDCSYPSYEDCQTWKFYNKYGEYYNQLGI